MSLPELRALDPQRVPDSARVARPLRVARLITRLNVGGPSYQAIFLTERLQDSQFTSVLMTGNVSAHEGSMEGLARKRGVDLTRIPGLGREISIRSEGLTLFSAYRQLRRVRPDIVHTHLAKAGTIGRIAAVLARTPIIVHTYHGHVFHGYFSPKKTELFLRIERKLSRWTDAIVVLGEALEREILGYGIGNREKMVRIPLGLELEPFLSAQGHRGELRRELALSEDQPLVGIVARLVPIKAHHLFLKAARKVVERRPDARFVIIGDGELRENLEEQATSLGFEVVRLEAGDRASRHSERLGAPAVFFLGFRDDLPRIYADLDVVVLCSANEGLPVSIIEALAASRPVVATEVGSVGDLVRPDETGILVQSGDVDALAEGILQQISNREKAEDMGRRGCQRVYPHLAIERLERDIRSLYAGLAERKGLYGRKR